MAMVAAVLWVAVEMEGEVAAESGGRRRSGVPFSMWPQGWRGKLNASPEQYEWEGGSRLAAAFPSGVPRCADTCLLLFDHAPKGALRA